MLLLRTLFFGSLLLIAAGCDNNSSKSPIVGPSTAGLTLGGHIAPGGGSSTELEVLTFQAACNNCLSIESLYPGYDFKPYIKRFAWDATQHLGTLIVWGSRLQNLPCPLYTDTLKGKYDTYIDTNASIIQENPQPVTIALLPEPTANPPELCANPTHSATLYQQVWQYIVNRFTNDGVTKVRWMFALDATEWSDHLDSTFWPTQTQLVGIDAFNATSVGLPFPTAICDYARETNLPFWIKETGALSGHQGQWFSTIPANCKGVGAVFVFDTKGQPPYDYTLDSEGKAAFTQL